MSETAQVRDFAANALHVPLFAELIESLPAAGRCAVLDLGPARCGLIDLYGRHRCRLEILDLPEVLDALGRLESPAQIQPLLMSRLPPIGPDPIETVLCWNLFDYFTPTMGQALMSCLRPRLKAGARFHALVEFSATHMPARPRHMAPASANELTLASESLALTRAPRHSRQSLEKLMPGLRAERTMLLGNGMQEYLLRC